jgi:hypothetical protein
VTTAATGIGRAIAKYPDASGFPALYDVLAVRGFGAQRRVYLRYVGHAGPNGVLVLDPDVLTTTDPQWLSARRFRVEILPRFETVP